MKNSYTLTYDPECECGVIIYHGHCMSAEFRQAHESILKLIQKHDLRKMLSDNRTMGVIEPADQQWLAEEFYPRLQKTDLQYSAIVVPRNRLAMLTIEDVLNNAKTNKSIVSYFADIPEAKEWLECVELSVSM